MYHRLPACVSFTAKMAMLHITGFKPVLFALKGCSVDKPRSKYYLKKLKLKKEEKVH